MRCSIFGKGINIMKNATLKVVATTKNGKVYQNLFVELEGINFQIKYAFYNKKLAYKVLKTLERINYEK